MGASYQIVLSGAGGQGIILGSLILGEAATLFDGKNAVQTQSYGIAARGGFCRSEVVISDNEILFPQVTAPDLVVALTEEAYRKCKGLDKGCLLVFDGSMIGATGVSGATELDFPINDLAKRFPNRTVINMISVGIIIGLSGVVSTGAVAKTIEKRFLSRDHYNCRAFFEGYKLVCNKKTTDGRSN